MFPGMGGRGMNSKQLNRMMKQLGINVEDIDGVEEVVIKTADKDYVFKDADVTIMEAQGSKTWQITGSPEEVEKETGPDFTQEDVELVAGQASVSEDEAREALEATDGQPAEAIIKLMED